MKSLIDELLARLEDDLRELNEATNDTIDNNRATIMRSIRITNDNMEIYTRNILNRMSDAETNIKRSMPGNSYNNYK